MIREYHPDVFASDGHSWAREAASTKTEQVIKPGVRWAHRKLVPSMTDSMLSATSTRGSNQESQVAIDWRNLAFNSE